MQKKIKLLKHYSFPLLLILCTAMGACLGIFLKEKAVALKPLGDIFLNLLFTTVVPLVFFSISSAVAEMSDLRRLGKIMACMLLLFTLTGVLAASLMILGVKIYPPSLTDQPLMELNVALTQIGPFERLVQAFTVPDFAELISKKNMLALIVFAMLTGLGASLAREEGKAFTAFLVSAHKVMMRVIKLVMLYAPIGLGAYFAYLVGSFGAERLFSSYLRVVTLYYPVAFFYFFIGFSIYVFGAVGSKGVKVFWGNMLTPSLTAWGTGSSLAAVPANLEATDRIGVPKDISRIVVPIGATIHMDGTCLGAVLKIALLFSLFGKPFCGIETYATAVGIALLSGMVMSGIPGGGFLGELLIVTLYGFPVEALPLISMVGALIDPPATMVNSVGDSVVSIAISRILSGKVFLKGLGSAEAV